MFGAAGPFRRALSVVLLTGLMATAFPVAHASSAEIEATDFGDLAPPRGTLVGAAVPDVGGRAPDISVHHYSSDADVSVATEADDLAAGRLPFISWGGADLDEVNAGDHDVTIKAYARALADLGLPVFLTWGPEMNVGTNAWSGPANADAGHVNGPWKYISAWRHVHHLFRDEGAANVIWVWQPAATSAPDEPSNAAHLYYPGDSYVDWVGISDDGPLSSIHDLTARYGPLYERFKGHKPVMLRLGRIGSVLGRELARTVETRFSGAKAVVFHEQAPAGFAMDPHFNPLAPARVAPASGPIVNVRDFGAVAGDEMDDTSAFLAALSTQATTIVPPGDYIISEQLMLPSDSRMWLSPAARLVASAELPTGDCILSLRDARNATVVGGILDGRKDANPDGYIYGLCIEGTNEDIRVVSTVVTDIPGGDGFYLQSGRRIRFEGIVAEGNVRQGMSMVGSLDDVVVVDSTFRDTTGDNPGAGLDIEPNPNGHEITDVLIKRSNFTGNQWGVILTRWADPSGSMNHIRLEDNVIADNRREGLYIRGTRSSTMRDIRVVGNRISGNGLTGMVVRKQVEIVCLRNVIRGNGVDGIGLQLNKARTTIKRNLISRNEATGVKVQHSRSFSITHNRVTLNGEHGIVTSPHKKRRKSGVVRKNHIQNNRRAFDG